jgi:NtrC-family two-component system response regulator AlgB
MKETSSTSIFLGGAFTVEEIEAEHIRQVLAQKRSLQEAADVLQVDRRTLLRKRKEWNL